MARQQLACHADCTQLGAFPGLSEELKVASNEGIVKPNVVRYKNSIAQPLAQLVCNLMKGGGFGDHVVVNSGQARDVKRDRRARVYQAFPALQFLFSIADDDGDFGYAMAFGVGTGGFYVDKSKAHGW